jgi:hypothetical protein
MERVPRRPKSNPLERLTRLGGLSEWAHANRSRNMTDI